MTAKNSQQPTANIYNSVQKFPSKIIIGSQVFSKCIDWYMLRCYYVLSRGYKDFDLHDKIQWGKPDIKDLKRLFFRLKELFDREGVKFSIIYGSLLGAVREGGLIKGDTDIDITVWDEESMASKLPTFQREGLKALRIYPGKLYSFTIDGSCYIDVYIMRELTGIRKLFWGKSCVSLFVFETPRRLFTGWSEIDFMGEKVTCPENPERLLEFWYGSDWRIPQNKKGTYLVKSAYYYDVLSSLPYRRPLLLYLKIRGYLAKIFDFLTKKEYRHKIFQRKNETGSSFTKSA